jgi:hypothetical protein
LHGSYKRITRLTGDDMDIHIVLHFHTSTLK